MWRTARNAAAVAQVSNYVGLGCNFNAGHQEGFGENQRRTWGLQPLADTGYSSQHGALPSETQ